MNKEEIRQLIRAEIRRSVGIKYSTSQDGIEIKIVLKDAESPDWSWRAEEIDNIRITRGELKEALGWE